MAYSTIDRPSNNFRTKLYTGTGSATSITFDESTNMQPDFIWVKSRNDTWNHNLVDSVRGALKVLRTNTTEAEENRTNNISSFNSNGFSIAGGDGLVNYSTTTTTYVAWNWKANGAGVSNTAGTISSTVSANTTSGFSIVSYTGTNANATVGHGLGVAPKFIIVKSRSDVASWHCYHSKLTDANYYILLNSTSAQASQTSIWQGTAPTSSVFSIGVNGSTNANGSTYIAYCFAEVKGFSKFSSYTGNGSTDGTFIYTGFKPAWIMIKRTTTFADSWFIYDNKINTSNVVNKYLTANTSDAEGTFTFLDILSNGFKTRTTDGAINGSGATYIYAAFAENPFVSSKGIPTTAR